MPAPSQIHASPAQVKRKRVNSPAKPPNTVFDSCEPERPFSPCRVDHRGKLTVASRAARTSSAGSVLPYTRIPAIRYQGHLCGHCPDGFKPLAGAEILKTPQCWAPPALVDGKLLTRDLKQAECVAAR
jgi:hypothetical protein